MTGLRTVGGALISPYTVTKNLYTNPLFKNGGGLFEIRRNLNVDPAATKIGFNVNGTLNWQPLWYGSGATGTTTTLTGIVGPVPEITTAMRKTWTSAATPGDTGFGHCQKNTTGFVVTPGTIYTASSWLRANCAIAKQGYIRIWFWDSAGVQVGYGNGSLVNLNSTTWTRISYTATVPAGAMYMTVWSDVTTGNFTVGDTVDGTGCLIEKSSRLGTYFDGRTPAIFGLSSTWSGNGTADANQPVQQGKAPAGGNVSARVYAYQPDSVGNGGVVLRPTEATQSIDTYLALAGDTGGIRLGIQPGKTYTVSAEGVASAADATELAYGRCVTIWYRRPDGTYVYAKSTPAPVGTVAARVSVTLAIASDATEAFVRLYNGSYLRDVTWNRVTIVEGTGTAHIDGSMPSDALNNYVWTGTADASTSERVTRQPFSAFAPDGVTLTQMQKVLPRSNLFLNPEMNASTGLVEFRRNYCQNPSVSVSGLGWTGPSSTVVAAPWDATRKSVRTTADGSTTAYCFSQVSPASFAIGDVVTVSCMVQVPAGVWVKPNVHVRTGNKYYNAGEQYIPSDGTPMRISHTATLTAADPDVDMAVRYFSANNAAAAVAGTTMYMGDVLIEKASSAGTYFDGDTVASGLVSSAWTGTAGASASIQRSPGPYNIGMTRGVAFQYAGGADGTGYCLRGKITDATVTSMAQRFSFAINVTAGQVYSMAGMMRYSQPGGFMFAVQWTDNANNVVATPASAPMTGIAANTWTYMKFENLVVPPGATKGQFWYGLNNGAILNEMMDVDRILVERVSTVGPFFSGSTPNDGDYTYAWTGTPDQSISTASP